MHTELPVVVVGAGPQGLAAAAHLAEREVPTIVLEAGDQAAAAVREWGHVRLFSGWSELVDAAAARLLEGQGWRRPTDGYPLGAEWADRYLQPLADALGDRIRFRSRVIGISRRGRDRLIDADRGQQAFTVHVATTDGAEYRVDARAVIDASGTWGSPNPAGADGLHALGERDAADVLAYRIPDHRSGQDYAGRHNVVVGAGHSALTAVIGLGTLVRRHPGTRVTWALRRGTIANALGGGAADQLSQRGQLGIRAKELVDAGVVEVVTGFRVSSIERAGERAILTAEDGRSLPAADHVAVLTGFRPDLSILSELRLDLDPALQAPARIAAEIDPNIHSCGSVAATGARDLAHAGEPDFYIVGAKSYGRAPTFLAMTGYEQVRSVTAALAGDHEAANRVELTLPQTGVCGGAGLFDSPGATGGGGCCGAPVPQVLQLGRTPASV